MRPVYISLARPSAVSVRRNSDSITSMLCAESSGMFPLSSADVGSPSCLSGDSGGWTPLCSFEGISVRLCAAWRNHIEEHTRDGVLQLCCSTEVLRSDAILQILFGLDEANLHLCKLEGTAREEEEDESNLPATFLVGIEATDEMDELLGDELFGHDELQLVEVSPLLLCQHRHRLQIATENKAKSQLNSSSSIILHPYRATNTHTSKAIRNGLQGLHSCFCTILHIQPVEQLDDVSIQPKQPSRQQATANNVSHRLCSTHSRSLNPDVGELVRDSDQHGLVNPIEEVVVDLGVLRHTAQQLVDQLAGSETHCMTVGFVRLNGEMEEKKSNSFYQIKDKKFHTSHQKVEDETQKWMIIFIFLLLFFFFLLLILCIGQRLETCGKLGHKLDHIFNSRLSFVHNHCILQVVDKLFMEQSLVLKLEEEMKHVADDSYGTPLCMFIQLITRTPETLLLLPSVQRSGAGQHCSSEPLQQLSPIHTPLSAPAPRQVVGLYALILPIRIRKNIYICWQQDRLGWRKRVPDGLPACDLRDHRAASRRRAGQQPERTRRAPTIYRRIPGDAERGSARGGMRCTSGRIISDNPPVLGSSPGREREREREVVGGSIMATGAGKAAQSPGPGSTVNGTAAELATIEQELYDYQMHSKMCKKIAQLTKVRSSADSACERGAPPDAHLSG
ncbi:hypothetical protein CCH79_00009326 [Gambusia affinis]|uniref:Uncharacterized protein n=1 Tax=Gambusia affinis TaxID=33528 RepID=A0A315W4P3_GAMAF|nr:hypothetical protein CCH79_00009326 [Gambusia affinis]